MPELIVATAKLTLTPDSTWKATEPMTVALKSNSPSPLCVGTNAGILSSQLNDGLDPKPKFGFNLLTPAASGGSLEISDLTADEETLAQALKQGSERFLTKSTTGKFTATVTQAAKDTSTPPKEVKPLKKGTLTGTWTIQTVPNKFMITD